MIRVRATISVRLPNGRFPSGSYAAVLGAARAGLVRDVERAFQTGTDPQAGQAWPARKTVRLNPLLVLTGRLKAGAVAAATGATVTGSTLTARVTAPKHAGYHHGGTKYLPRRRLIGASVGTVGVLARALKSEGVRVLTRGS